jgi:hypothetical protein
MEKIIKIIKNIVRDIFPIREISYAQCGEDIIIKRAFNVLGIKKPKYIDIGTHHPTLFSNTYMFYKKGSFGICIEPCHSLFKKIKNKRKRDICLNIGISDNYVKKAPFYIMTAQTLNTFSKEDAHKNEVAKKIYGNQKIEKIEYLDMVPMNSILEKYHEKFNDLISIDTEGFDEKIIKSINFTKYRPKILCIETIEQNDNGNLIKNEEIIKIMKDNNYFIYADTHINTIFIDKNIW